MADWIWALIAAFAGLIVGASVARVVRGAMAKPNRPRVVRQAAAPAASLVFSVLLVAGLMTALGFVNDEALDQIPEDLVDYLPNALSALIVLIIGNVVATLAATAVDGALSRAGGRAREQLPRVVRLVVLAFAGILAAAQLGVDTTIIDIGVAAVLFSLGLAAALMVGFGSRTVSSEIAAGRALRRVVHNGDHLTLDDISGTVVDVQSVMVELRTDEGRTVLVPNSDVLAGRVVIERAEREPRE
ncbi:MAG: mechanosensitive ion channel [Acidimicrobiia bacterium]|nr:mechanosensitive ion channel [Acidimicrobiia bacterium]